jgi:hypothetical protein
VSRSLCHGRDPTSRRQRRTADALLLPHRRGRAPTLRPRHRSAAGVTGSPSVAGHLSLALVHPRASRQPPAVSDCDAAWLARRHVGSRRRVMQRGERVPRHGAERHGGVAPSAAEVGTGCRVGQHGSIGQLGDRAVHPQRHRCPPLVRLGCRSGHVTTQSGNRPAQGTASVARLAAWSGLASGRERGAFSGVFSPGPAEEDDRDQHQVDR